MNKLVIFNNNKVIYEFDRVVILETKQSAFIDKMDRDMKRGISIDGELLENPDDLQRTTFIVMNLIKAIQQDNDATVFATCAYLVNRLPELIELRANDSGNTVKIEFIEEQKQE